MDMRLYELKCDTVISLDMKLSSLTSNKPSCSYDQPSSDLIKWSLPKSPGKHSHASQSTKHISSMTLEVDTLLQIKKWWDAVLSTLCKNLSTNNICPAYTYIKAENQNISSFLLSVS